MNKLDTSAAKDAQCQVWLKFAQCYFVIISPWKRTGFFIRTNLNPLHPSMLCASFVEIGPVVLEKTFNFRQCIFVNDLCKVWLKLAQWFWRRRSIQFVNVFWLFPNYLPLEKGRTLYLNKLYSLSLKDALCQVWLKMAQWFWMMKL